MSDEVASNGLKFTKFLENWSDGSKFGVGVSTHVCVHAHTHHITSYHIDPIHLLFTVRKGQ